MAEGEGFEPSVALATLVFKTSAFVRSAIPPSAGEIRSRQGESYPHDDAGLEGSSKLANNIEEDEARRRQRASSGTDSLAAVGVWVIVLAVLSLTDHHRIGTILTVFAGWAIKWASATIARSISPPRRVETSVEPRA